MDERRSVPRERMVNAGGLIAVDEHTSLACMIDDRSTRGVRLTLPDAHCVPDIFLLTAGCLDSPQVCHVAWRTDEVIGARFAPARE